MLVYHGGSYGQANLTLRPGMNRPSEDAWFKLETDEHGELRRLARHIVVSFKDGAAEVDEALGAFLLEEGLVSAEPLPFTPRPVPGSWSEAYPLPEPRKPPIPVGQRMTPEVAASQVQRLGERMRR